MDREATVGFDQMVDELQQEIAEREKALYSDIVLREASAPKNMGRLDDADLHGKVRGWCGDSMEIYLRLHDGHIQRATFLTDGCGATVACGSLLTQMVKGMKLERAGWILPKDLVNALGGLPEESMHCAGLAISTLHNALFSWRMSKMEDAEEVD